MSALVARSLVFFTSAAVLVLEILAGRLMAPYLGVTIETFTGIIGVVLAGIALGAWYGGTLADSRSPRSMLGPMILAGGLLALAAPTIVHWVGPSMRAAGPIEIVILTASAFFLPAVVLSAVPPMVVKLRLRSLDETGSVVGSLSAVGTAGALAGTFVTGFVLIATLPTDVAVLVLGIALIALGSGLSIPAARSRLLSVAVIGALVGGAALFGVDGPCDEETTYFCAYVTIDDERPSGRVLWLDTLRHSYVDLDDPLHVEFRYARLITAVIAEQPEGPLDALYIGGGGFTLPRYLSETRPGSTNTVLEIDPSLVDIARDDLGLTDRPDIRIEIGDARLALPEQPARAFDVVVGDAFGGLSVPWHLTTVEFSELIEDRLRPGGTYVLNLIDYPPLRFARAEVATLAAVFDHVIVVSLPPYLAGDAGGNFIVAASDEPFDLDAIRKAIVSAGDGDEILVGPEVTDFIDGASELTDDFAPVDQLLTRP